MRQEDAAGEGRFPNARTSLPHQAVEASPARPTYVALLAGLARAPEPIVAEVVADVARPDDDRTVVRAAVEPVVQRLLEGLLAAAPRPGELARLREEGAAAARGGRPVAEPIDRYLSAGWAIWDAATHRRAATRADLATLGAALLRAGDRAAAAIAEGHGAEERRIAGRTAAARRAWVDELLALEPGDAAGLARMRLRGDALGIRLGSAYRVVTATLGRVVEDELDVEALVRDALGTPPRRALPRADALHGSGPTGGGGTVDRLDADDRASDGLAVVRGGRVVLAVPAARFEAGRIAAAITERAGPDPWTGVVGPLVGPGALGAATRDGSADLTVALASGSVGVLIDAAAVALERALLADPMVLASAVAHELAPVLGAPRNATELVHTLEVWLEHGQALRATARSLGVAPRTVAYRLERIESLLGRRLSGPVVGRLAVALFARRLLAAQRPRPVSG